MPPGDMGQSLGYLSRLAFRRFARAMEKRTHGHGVGAGQWPFLRVLWAEDGLTQRELSQRVDMRAPTTAKALQTLERNGLIRRAPSRMDRRKIHIFLTADGRALKDVLMPYVDEVNALATQGIDSEDVERLRRLLAAVAANLVEDVGL
jgi:DNA-binding MarR family transcriptional regulator